MTHVQSNVQNGEIWLQEGPVYTEVVRYTALDGKPYWVAEGIIFLEYDAAMDHLTRLGFTPYDGRSDDA